MGRKPVIKEKKRLPDDPDWNEVEHEYITNPNISCKLLAQRYGYSEPAIRMRCTRGDWVRKRKEYAYKKSDEMCSKAINQIADRIAETTSKLLEELNNASNELYIHEEVNMFGKHIKQETETVRVPKLTALIKALTNIEKIQLEKDKLQLEKDRLQGDETENKVIAYMDSIREVLKNNGETEEEEEETETKA